MKVSSLAIAHVGVVYPEVGIVFLSRSMMVVSLTSVITAVITVGRARRVDKTEVAH